MLAQQAKRVALHHELALRAKPWFAEILPVAGAAVIGSTALAVHPLLLQHLPARLALKQTYKLVMMFAVTGLDVPVQKLAFPGQGFGLRPPRQLGQMPTKIARIEVRVNGDELIPDWARFASHERGLTVVQRIDDHRPDVVAPPLPDALSD